MVRVLQIFKGNQEYVTVKDKCHVHISLDRGDIRSISWWVTDRLLK